MIIYLSVQKIYSYFYNHVRIYNEKNIIIFTGAGQSNKLFNYDFINNKYVKNNLVDKLKK